MSFINVIKRIFEQNIRTLTSQIQLSDNNNLVYLATSNDTKYIIKVYQNKGMYSDKEAYLLNKISNKNLRKMYYYEEKPAGIDYPISILEYIEGETLLDHVKNDLSLENAEKYTTQIFNFLQDCFEHAEDGFGCIVNDQEYSHESWQSYLFDALTNPMKDLLQYNISDLLEESFAIYFNCQQQISCENPVIVPIDLNLSNFIISKDNEVKVIDPGAIIAGDSHNAYGEFAAHTYKTLLWDCFAKNLSNDSLKRVHIYALFDDLNILSFIARHGGDVYKACPWGNPHTFIELIKLHIKEITK